MPVVPQYDTLQVKQDVGINYRNTTRASPDMFGAGVGQAVSGLGGAIGNYGQAMAQIEALDNGNISKDAYIKTTEELRKLGYDENGFFSKQGAAAVEGLKGYEEQAREIIKKGGEGLPPGALRQYQIDAEDALQSSLNKAFSYTMDQRKSWTIDTGNSLLKSYADDALVQFGNEDAAKKAIEQGKQELAKQAALNGDSPKTLALKQRDFASAIRYNSALRMLTDDPVAAKKYYDEHKDDFNGDHQYKFEEALKTPLLNANVKSNTAKFFSGQSAGGPAGSVAGTGGGEAIDTGKTGGGASDPAALLRHNEGFRDTPYWDVNAYRVGYGSDTITRADGSVVRVAPGMRITRDDAERDLSRRVNEEFIPGIVKQVGQDAWDKLSSTARTGLVSVAYNYGTLPFRVANAVVMGDPEEIAKQVDALGGDNNGVNRARRTLEANIIRGMTGIPASQQGTTPGLADVEHFLAGISDPTEADLTRKAITGALDLQDKARKEQQQATLAQAFQAIETDGTSPYDLPPDVTTAIGPEGMSKLMDYWGKRSKGEPTRTDERTMMKLQDMYTDDPVAFGQMNLFDYRGVLSDEDWGKVQEWRKNARTDLHKAKEDGINYTTAFDMAKPYLNAAGILTEKTNGNDPDPKVLASYRTSLTRRLNDFRAKNNGMMPSNNDILEIVADSLLPIAITTKKDWWPDSTTSGHLFEADQLDAGQSFKYDVKMEDIPTDVLDAIKTRLETKLGRVPSDEEKIAEYVNYTHAMAAMPNRY